MRRAWLLSGLLACGTPEAPITRERFPRAEEDERLSVVTRSATLVVRGPGPEREDAEPMCEPGAVVDCLPRGISIGRHRLVAHCQLDFDGAWRWNRASCNTPLVLSFDDAPVAFTKPAGGATEWVSARTPWLALDANGNGCVDGEEELFAPTGDDTNGFAKLARLDANGDGRVDARDPAWSSILVWSDTNQDRACTSDEVRSLADHGVVALATEYAPPPSIPFGSYEGERGAFFMSGGARGRIIDVYLAPLR